MAVSLGPLMEVARIQSEINRLFENLTDLGDEQGGAWIPNVDILETETHLLLRVDLPGVDPAALSVAVHGGTLVLRGDKRADPPAGGGVEAVEAERRFGPFRRTIHLGVPVNTRQAEAHLNDGLLRISFPRVPNRRGEEVPIEVRTS